MEPSPPVFGCIIPSRPLLANAQHLPPNRFVFSIEHGESLNHLVVFLTGAVPLPEGYGASVHFLFPTKGWQILGMITPTKPSAIFRLRGSAVPSSFAGAASGFGAGSSGGLMAQIGILVEPLADVEAQCASLPSSAHLGAVVPSSGPPSAPDPATTVAVAKAVGTNLYNYLSGFAVPAPHGSAGSWVDMGAVEKWWRQFEQKCRASGGADWLLKTGP